MRLPENKLGHPAYFGVLPPFRIVSEHPPLDQDRAYACKIHLAYPEKRQPAEGLLAALGVEGRIASAGLAPKERIE